jgi:hypothetical protein
MPNGLDSYISDLLMRFAQVQYYWKSGMLNRATILADNGWGLEVIRNYTAVIWG